MQRATRQIAALADPTRGMIFEVIRRSPSSVRQITDRVGISQPAVSQHLKVLREAALVVPTARGASNIYSIDRRGLETLRAWLDAMWDDALDEFEQAATRESGK